MISTSNCGTVHLKRWLFQSQWSVLVIVWLYTSNNDCCNSVNTISVTQLFRINTIVLQHWIQSVIIWQKLYTFQHLGMMSCWHLRPFCLSVDGSGRGGGSSTPLIGNIILHDKVKFWKASSSHYHQGNGYHFEGVFFTICSLFWLISAGSVIRCVLFSFLFFFFFVFFAVIFTCIGFGQLVFCVLLCLEFPSSLYFFLSFFQKNISLITPIPTKFCFCLFVLILVGSLFRVGGWGE